VPELKVPGRLHVLWEGWVVTRTDRQTNEIALGEEAIIPVFGSFRRVNQKLIELLKGLTADDWNRPTVIPSRDVKDLAAHLLHGSLRRTTSLRDGYRRPNPPIDDMKSLINFIQRDNREFMTGMKRMSPQILIELISLYDEKVVTLFEAMDLHKEGLGVAWAGEKVSRNWFDIAREYTEKWHHQQQIRDATSQPPLDDPELLAPVLETFARGIPFAFRNLKLPKDYRVSIETTGPVTCRWILKREDDFWTLWHGQNSEAQTTVTIPADVAWRIWTNGMNGAEAKAEIRVEGEEGICYKWDFARR
jgi:uncharacterized protein (TIGR03083 family)